MDSRQMRPLTGSNMQVHVRLRRRLAEQLGNTRLVVNHQQLLDNLDNVITALATID